MEGLILAFAVCALVICSANVICFAVGVKVGQSLQKGEKPIVLPKLITPKKKEAMQKENLDVILENIENYDGTPAGQKDLPWR